VIAAFQKTHPSIKVNYSVINGDYGLAIAYSCALIALMPNAVLGGVLLFMFGMVASVGIDIIGRNMASRRDAVILAASLAVGLGIQAAPPGAFDVVPQALRILVTDGIVMGILLAMGLNLLLPKEER